MAKQEVAMSMSELVRTMVESMVDEPRTVQVSADLQNVERLTINVVVASGDVGKVIGKQGRTVRAMRTILGAASMTAGVPTSLNIQENDR